MSYVPDPKNDDGTNDIKDLYRGLDTDRGYYYFHSENFTTSSSRVE